MKKAVFQVVILAVLTLPLSGCLDRWLFSPEYEITLAQPDKKLHRNIDKFAQDRLTAVELAEDEADRLQQELYHEENLRDALQEKMHALGYYDAQVRFEDSDKGWTGAYHITAGKQYTITDIRVEPDDYHTDLKQMNDLTGQLLDAVRVLSVQADLYQNLLEENCYFNLDIDHNVILNREQKTADIIFHIQAGDNVSFGKTSFDGQETVEVDYIRRLIPWEEGDCFQRRKLEILQARLFETGLFSGAEIVLPETVTQDMAVPVKVLVKERAHRSVGLGMSYYTDEGAGVFASWRHRNIGGAGEELDTTLRVTELQQTLKGVYTKPYFLRDDQSLSLQADLTSEDSDAYKDFGLRTGVSVTRRLSRYIEGSTGVNLSILEIDDKITQDTSSFGLVSFPQRLRFDDRDNRLNPSKGFYSQLHVEPFVDVLGKTDPFWKTTVSARTYFSLNDDTVLALRGKAGSILGGSVEDIPATERYFSGGGGSVRGFAYQEAGPLVNGDPAGGRSVVEGSAEIRHRFNDSFGGVAFVDAGNVSDNSFPDLSNAYIGAGVGARYYTDFGPLRFDIGVPVNKKENRDSYQFYISIGQAF